MLAAVACAAAFMLGLNSPAGADYVFIGSGTSGACFPCRNEQL
jgi:hypothetical protein